MQASFMASAAGDIFVNRFCPAQPSKATIIFFPPLHEELNKSRAMVAQQARKFAQLGYETIVFDLYGTGDSEGDFSQASLASWMQDCELIYQLAFAKQQPIYFWACRFGALLAMKLIELIQPELKQLLLWQPLASGKQQVSQLLRLQRMSTMLSGQPEIAQPDTVQQQTDVEIAGYRYANNLLHDIEQLRIEQAVLSCPIQLFHISPVEPANMQMSHQVYAQLCNKADMPLNLHYIAGDSFWNSQEITLVPELQDKSLQALQTV